MILNTFNKEVVLKCFKELQELGDETLITNSNQSLTVEQAEYCNYLMLFYDFFLHRIDLRVFNPEDEHFTSSVRMCPYYEFKNEVLRNKWEGIEKQSNKELNKLGLK
jgi:hypothetical protein